jgi:hypothetical protein
MSELSMLEVSTKELSVHATRVDIDRIQLAMSGTAETPAYDALMTLVRRLQAETHERRPSEVVVDLRGLDFMNSACLKTFVTWLGELREADASAQYAVRFLFDRNKHWQRRTVGALKCFAPTLVTIEE